MLYTAKDSLNALALRAHQVGCHWKEMLNQDPLSRRSQEV